MHIKFKNKVIILILLLSASILSQYKSLSPLELLAYQGKSLRRVKAASSNFYPELSIPIIETDNDGRIEKANESAISIFGDIKGQNITTVFSLASTPMSDFVCEIDTQVFKLISNMSPDGTIWTGFNMTEDYYDRLTKVAYRKDYYPVRLKEAISFSMHDGPLSVIIIDGDYIKAINDNFGHLEGDNAIVFMAETIKKSLRESDLLFHFGGDEFSIILPDTSEDEAQIVANRINQAFRDTAIVMAGEEYIITISLGFTTFRPNEDIIAAIKSGLADHISEHITDTADKAAYDAKENGRNGNSYLELDLKDLP
ncbi:MAG: sensor domain-containing diguanylate cyclase [Candidatus Kaelpia aquatica]|nr:sensor domain-containing diguanylate cyclase [Candidatus Kaelpia aquatica]